MSTTPRALLSVHEAREALGGISATTFYALVSDGAIPLVKIRRRSFVRADDVEALIERGRKVAVG